MDNIIYKSNGYSAGFMVGTVVKDDPEKRF
jgi:hypothetical protein